MNVNASPIPEPGGKLVQIEDFADTGLAIASSRQRRDRALLAIGCGVMLIAALYNFVIAAPRYASEFSYVVRSMDGSHQRFSFMNFSSSGDSADNSQAIVAYIRSRDMLAAINRDHLIDRIFADPRVDEFSAFPSLLAGSGTEDLFRHFQRFVTASFDEQSNITYVEVQAFTAAEAQAVAQRIRQASETKVNTLNERARQNMTDAAQREVGAARAALVANLDQLNIARNRDRVIEPKLEAGAAVKVASASSEQLAATNIELDQTKRTSPDSPLIPGQRARRAALQSELRRQSSAEAGGHGSLADRMRPYEQLSAQREIAQSRLLAASLALASARNSADRNRVYLEWIAQPDRPDYPLYPRRFRNLAIVAILTASLLWIARSLLDLLIDDYE